MQVSHVRLSAPSFKSLAIAKMGRPVKGQRPVHRVIVVSDAKGYQWVHNKIFAPHEINKAMEIVRKIDDMGNVNEQHWRLAHKEY